MRFLIKPEKAHLDSVNNLKNVVRKIDYQIQAIEGDNKEQSSHQAHLNLPEEQAFIPFEQLTQKIVIEWIKKGLGDHYETLCENLKTRFETNKETQTVALPWADPKPEAEPAAD